MIKTMKKLIFLTIFLLFPLSILAQDTIPATSQVSVNVPDTNAEKSAQKREFLRPELCWRTVQFQNERRIIS